MLDKLNLHVYKNGESFPLIKGFTIDKFRILLKNDLFKNQDTIKWGFGVENFDCVQIDDKLLRVDTFRFIETVLCDVYEFIQINDRHKLSLDIGASDGLTTYLMTRFSDKVVAFEPSFIHLYNAHVNLKNLHNVKLIPVALGNIQEHKIVDSLNICNVEDLEYKHIPASNIFVVRLDDFSLAPSLIKIDVEGAELDVLKGGELTITNYYPKLLLSVYHYPGEDEVIKEYLLSIGYNHFDYLDHLRFRIMACKRI